MSPAIVPASGFQAGSLFRRIARVAFQGICIGEVMVDLGSLALVRRVGKGRSSPVHRWSWPDLIYSLPGSR